MDGVLGDAFIVLYESVTVGLELPFRAIQSSIVSDSVICPEDSATVGGVSIRSVSRIELLRINSAGVTPVEVFSTVFIIRCTIGSCS